MIAIFDSGYGGLTVLKPILESLPEYDYIYLGDNARSPYGNHSRENIKTFCEQAVEYLFDRGAKLIIFACNTASSVALRHVQQKYLDGKDEHQRKILGVLIPVAEQVVETTKNKKVAIIGTRATIESGSYEEEIEKLDPKIKVYKRACPLFVPFIEEDWHHRPEAVSIAKKYLRPLKSTNADTLVLGCTHYPLMQRTIQRIMSNKVTVISSGPVTAQKLKQYLQRHPDIESKLTKGKKRHFLTTDDPEAFKKFVEKHFKIKVGKVEKVAINQG